LRTIFLADFVFAIKNSFGRPIWRRGGKYINHPWASTAADQRK